MIKFVHDWMPSWQNVLVGVVLYKIWHTMLSVIEGARAAKRVNLQLALLLTYIQIKDPLFTYLISQVGIDVLEERDKK